MPIINGFDSDIIYDQLINQTFVINLERSTGKMSAMNDSLKRLNITYERINAVDGYQVVIVDQKNGTEFTGYDLKNNPDLLIEDVNYLIKCIPGSPEWEAINFQYKAKPIKASAGEFGCSCSHRYIWQMMIQRNYTAVNVFEDDAFMFDYYKASIEKSRLYNYDFDIAYLHKYAYPHQWNDRSHDGKFVKFHDYLYSTLNYIVSIKGAKKLLDITQSTDIRCVDCVINSKSQRLNSYIATQGLVSPIGASEINEMGRAF